MEGRVALPFTFHPFWGSEAPRPPLGLEKENTLSRKSVCRHVHRRTESPCGRPHCPPTWAEGQSSGQIPHSSANPFLWTKYTPTKECQGLDMLMTLWRKTACREYKNDWRNCYSQITHEKGSNAPMLGDSLSCQKALFKCETLLIICSKRQQAGLDDVQARRSFLKWQSSDGSISHFPSASHVTRESELGCRLCWWPALWFGALSLTLRSPHRYSQHTNSTSS